MKEIIGIVFLILLCGCQTIKPDDSKSTNLPTSNNILNKFKPGVIDSFNKAREIQYKGEEDGEDYWKTPKETLSSKQGDCEDKAFYLQDMLLELGVDSWVVVGKFIPDSKDWHGWVECNSFGTRYILDPTAGKIIRQKDRGVLYDSGEELATKWDLYYTRQKLLLMKRRVEKGENKIWEGATIFGNKEVQ